MMGGLLNPGNRTLVSMLNKSMTGSVVSGFLALMLSAINMYICQQYFIYHFFIVPFMQLIQSSACLLLWWLYDDAACQMSTFLQKFIKFSKLQCVPAPEFILLGSPYFEKIILHIFIRLSALKSTTYFITGDLLWQYTIPR